MKRQMTISYQNREGKYNSSGVGPMFKSLPPVPKIMIANHILEKYGFSIGDKILVEYLPGQIIITKLKNNE